MEPTRREFAAGFGAALAPPRQLPEPSYLRLAQTGELDARARALREIYRSCRLCPRQCGVNRLQGETGVCRLPARAKVFSAHPHFGEEPPVTGRSGSGTVFFSRCNLLCVFCQNWEINHRGDGWFYSDEELGRLFLSVQNMGCHNLNLVTPTHLLPNIISALSHAVRRGFRLPLVYNCGGYESLEAIKLLDGIVDIYLPDFKYMDGKIAARLSSGAADYPERAAEAVTEMHRQTGVLQLDDRGVARRGLLIRHLVLPDNLAGTDRFVKWVAENLSRDTWVNIMGQYRPEYKAKQHPPLDRRITLAEHRQALKWAREAGLVHVLA
ncbi:MAG: radical SAM protein [Bryobacteraceae bacterium]|nr:MAG: radical SAM protein [Bryobacteraceae bacterium]